MTDTLFVNGLVLHAYHGVNQHEGRVGQPFVLDIELELELTDASRTDKLVDTVSYDDIVEVATSAFRAERYRLVEAAAGAVADAMLKTFARVASIRITVRKPHAPIAAVFEAVGVTLSRSRHG